MSVFEVVSKFNFLPSEERGRFYVFSNQFNTLVTTLNGLFSTTGGLNLTVVPTSNLGDAANAINITDKVIGKIVVGSDGLIYSASGTAATDSWNASDGTSDITPS
jgi:hypothetical protein